MLIRLLMSFSLFFVSNFTAAATSTSQPLCKADESSALLQFKDGFIIDKNASPFASAYPKVESWKDGNNCCSWDGVECDNVTGHVIGLDLSSSCLFGSIDSTSTLFHLVHLRRLNLAYNHFNYSNIPSHFGHLSELTYLNLCSSSFSGQIPSNISDLSKLSILDFSSNGKLFLKNPGFESFVQNLTSLEDLDLSWVPMFSRVPDILANFSSLKSLSLRNCELYGKFPIGIFQLPNLQSILLSVNWDLEGHLPEFNYTSPLHSIQLAHTSFSGELPASIGKLASFDTLNIWECQFTGQVPASLGNLSNLDYLDISNNDFESQNLSSLSWVAKETKLTLLGLSDISLNSETIPSYFANLTQLNVLMLSGCEISGPIPSWLMNMSQLTVLELSRNSLRGSIPDSITNLRNLEILNLALNNLSGIVEFDMFSKLIKLDTLLLSNNNLTLFVKANINATLQKFSGIGLASCDLSQFPHFLQLQDELQLLDLSHNSIQGQIPDWILKANEDTLEYLDLSDNFLTSFESYPVRFPWTRLTFLNLCCNMLQGSLPVPPPSTKFYSVSSNNLTGEIPSTICSLDSLYALNLFDNKLIGRIPECLGYMSESLQILNLGRNNFGGEIPNLYTNKCSIKMMALDSNQLDGKLPRSLVNCSSLEFLSFGHNRISDVFPSWLGELEELKILILRHNNFHGVLRSRAKKPDFPMLRIVDISRNRFSGQLQDNFFLTWNSMKKKDDDSSGYIQAIKYLPFSNNNWMTAVDVYSTSITNKGNDLVYAKIWESLVAMDFSGNEFEGLIPEVIGSLNGIRILNFSRNNLHGGIPLSLKNLTEIESLDLSLNKLSGDIPQQLTQLYFLVIFNVSYNHLTGPIPRGKQFDTFQNDSYLGNEGLCGNPLSRECKSLEPPSPSFSSSESQDDKDSELKFDWKPVLIGYCSGLVIGLMIGHIVTAIKYQWFLKTFNIKQPRIPRTRRVHL